MPTMPAIASPISSASRTTAPEFQQPQTSFEAADRHLDVVVRAI
jgi:hypothetical protein